MPYWRNWAAHEATSPHHRSRTGHDHRARPLRCPHARRSRHLPGPRGLPGRRIYRWPDLEEPGRATGGQTYVFEHFSGVYRRIYADPDAAPAIHSRLVALELALRVTAVPVVNRPFGGWQNMSKPFQMLMLQRHDLTAPTSRSTSIPDDFSPSWKTPATLFTSPTAAYVASWGASPPSTENAPNGLAAAPPYFRSASSVTTFACTCFGVRLLRSESSRTRSITGIFDRADRSQGSTWSDPCRRRSKERASGSPP